MINAASDVLCIYDMEERLIIKKTEEFLDRICYTGNDRDYLKELISRLVNTIIKNKISIKNQSVYSLLWHCFKKSKGTILLEAKNSLNEIMLNKETISILKELGLKGNITLLKVLKISSEIIIEQVVYEQSKLGTWIG